MSIAKVKTAYNNIFDDEYREARNRLDEILENKPKTETKVKDLLRRDKDEFKKFIKLYELKTKYEEEHMRESETLFDLVNKKDKQWDDFKYGIMEKDRNLYFNLSQVI